MQNSENKRNQNIGRKGEQAALDFAQQNGYTLVSRNFRTPYGEIDLILHHTVKECLVFVEVKTRTSIHFGFPELAVDQKKMNHFINSAQFYINSQTDLQLRWRLDVVSVMFDSKLAKNPEIKWIENVTLDR